MRPIIPRSRSVTGVLVLATLVLAGCATVPPDQDPVQIRLNDLDARVTKVERVISNQSLVHLAQQTDSLQAQVRDLRGQVESLENANRELTQQDHDLYADLDKRVTALEHGGVAGAGAGAGAGGAAGVAGATSTPGTGGSAATAGSGTATPTEQSVYGQAFAALKAGSYSVAISGFQGFLKTYPASPLAPNAEYWLGQAHYVNQDFAAAERDFRTVLEKWPSSGKAPDAMFDLGNTQLAQGKTAKGRATLTQLVSQFPGTDAAKRAQARLNARTSK